MNFMSNTEISMDKFNKYGELYISPIINDKQYMFLSCIYCKYISWEFDTFLKHLDSSHRAIDNICLNLYKKDSITEENSQSLKNTNPKINSKPSLSREIDPLGEKHFDFCALSPVTIKTEKSETIEYKNETQTEVKITSKDISEINEVYQINEFKHNDDNGLHFEQDKICIDADLNEDDDSYADAKNDLKHYDKDNKKSNLKNLTKNRELIEFIINAYRKQNILWDSVNKRKKIITSEKQEAFEIILKNIKEISKINITRQQIEHIIKSLKLRFAHYLRHRDKKESLKPLWYFELLTFLEPHLNVKKKKSGICKKLNDSQLLTLIKILKENECFWNENNIYHTSITNKQEILKRITEDFLKICDLADFNSNIMQNSIDEIIEMARKENATKMQYLENDKCDDYQSSCKFYKEIEFLLPHVGPFKCKYCLKIFVDIYAYKFHMSRHDGIKPFKCMECPRELTHKKEFVCHLRRHTKECPFQCNACDKSFPSQKEWHRHVIKHGSKPYICELCADSFYTQHQLTNHMKNHNNIKDHVCPQCGKGFTHRGLLRQHLQTHNKTKCFCNLCNNIYSNPRSLRKHYVRVHESGDQQAVSSKAQYNCQICKITFSSIQDAKQHRKEHKRSNPAERKHVCDICGHNFAYPRNLADHKKIHSNIRDQVCDVCGKAFTNANLLNQHKNVHTGEKFVCKACGKDYAHYRGLCRHITKAHSTNIKDLDAVLEKQNMSSLSLHY